MRLTSVRKLRTLYLYDICAIALKGGKNIDISEIRHISGMSQRLFSDYLGIPIGTLRNWEQGISSPPEYVFQMIANSIRRDNMINIETLEFIEKLDKLAELTENGFEKFSNSTPKTLLEKIVYDDSSEDEDNHYKVVCDFTPLEEDHEVLCYHDSYSTEYTIRAVIPKDDIPYLLVKFTYSHKSIIIENGNWSF